VNAESTSGRRVILQCPNLFGDQAALFPRDIGCVTGLLRRKVAGKAVPIFAWHHYPKYRIETIPVVAAWPSARAGRRRKEVLEALPLVVSKGASVTVFVGLGSRHLFSTTRAGRDFPRAVRLPPLPARHQKKVRGDASGWKDPAGRLRCEVSR
jgi:hypothetical protein